MGEEVQVVESCLVSPSSETASKALRLSPLDLVLANRGHVPLVHFYRRPVGATDFFDVTRLTAALGKALVPFYPFAGRLVVDDDGRLQINCNSQGALFLVAHSDLTVDHFSDFKPSSELRRLFVPRMDYSPDAACIVCAIQVTFLKCGGVVLGTALHHVAMDGNGAFLFFRMWSAFSRDGDRAVVKLPCHNRALLSARAPPVVHPDALSIFCPKLNLSEPPEPVTTEVFLLGKDQLSALKRTCGGGVSTFCAVSAHVWQCLCLARRLPPDSTTRLTFPANVRRSLTPPLPDGYFGNAVITLAAAGEAGNISSGDLASVAGRIKGVLGRLDDELVRSAVDYLELANRDSRPARGSMPVTELRVISWLGMPIYDADFVWGKPVAMLRAESNHGGFVYLMNGAQGDGGVRVVMCIEAAILGEFQRLLYARFERLLRAKL